MGDLVGHLIPGVFLVSFGLYYAWLASLAILRGQRLLVPPLPPRDKRLRGWLQQLPIEGLLKTAVSIPAILGSFFFPVGSNRFAIIDWEDPEQQFLHHNTWQHVTIYIFLFLSGMVDVVSRSWLARQQVKLEQAALALAFQGTAMIFISHTEGKDVLEVRSHFLLALPIMLIALVLTIELWFPDQPVLWVFKAWMLLLFGSWCAHLGSILYHPITGHPWRADKPGDIMFVTTFFCWHLILDALMIAGVYGLCSLWHHRYPPQQGSKRVGYQLCPTDSITEDLKKLLPEMNRADGRI
ncbi:transmembrane epididymal protein 1A-like [Trichosurus vulpecula]|uniref:transmembrane epididymal protein 1A-like n=1 Tax=Trichosurus vulpecula TaxID=9337 RepID=UPI00186B3F15|nr:transmembrane epididymal protein 1A-like [Trichosurus vulpecula]